MVDYKKKYKKIVDELIGKSYPILKNEKIVIREKRHGKFTAYVIELHFFMIINIDPRARKYSRKLLMGLLAHELCHLEDWQKNSFISNLLFLFKLTSRKFRVDNERKTDISTINKGYARELYAQRKSRWKEVTTSHIGKKIYMSPEQIKSYAKKVGKWQ